MENLAPERTLTRSGSPGSPRCLPMAFSSLSSALPTSWVRPSGHPPAMYARQASVEMVNPGGTGSSRTDVISARLAPLPPRRSFISMGGLRCLWSKLKTYPIRALLPLATALSLPTGAGASREREPGPQLLDEAVDGHPHLVGAVPLPDGHGHVVEGVEV